MSDCVLSFIQRCQVAVGLYECARTLGDRSATVGCICAVPPCNGKADQMAVTLALLKIATGTLALRDAELLTKLHERSSHVRGSPAARLALDWIASHYSEETTSLEACATACRRSRWHVSRVLAAETGHAFSSHINGLRVLKALVLLRSTTLSIKQVAGCVGYSRTSELDRNFRQSLRLTPSECRATVVRRMVHLTT
jgi:AraC-like DNA-binding protein